MEGVRSWDRPRALFPIFLIPREQRDQGWEREWGVRPKIRDFPFFSHLSVPGGNSLEQREWERGRDVPKSSRENSINDSLEYSLTPPHQTSPIRSEIPWKRNIPWHLREGKRGFGEPEVGKGWNFFHVRPWQRPPPLPSPPHIPFPASCDFHGNCGYKFHGNPMATHPGGGRGPGMLSGERSPPCPSRNPWNSQGSWSSAWERRDYPGA